MHESAVNEPSSSKIRKKNKPLNSNSSKKKIQLDLQDVEGSDDGEYGKDLRRPLQQVATPIDSVNNFHLGAHAKHISAISDSADSRSQFPQGGKQSQYGGQGARGELGIQYIEFIYQKNVMLQQEISDSLDQMMELDSEHIKERQKWENEVQELQRQIYLYQNKGVNNNKNFQQ